MSDPVDISHIIKNVDQLPSLPSVIGKVLEMMRNPKTSMTEIGAVISEDLALSSKILKIVNSAFYGFAHKISTISRAIVILGFNSLKSAILGVSVINTFQMHYTGDNVNYFYSREDFWRHSIAVGACSRVIAKKMRMLEVEEAFLAGILHDIGKLVLDQFAHDQFIKILEYAQENQITFLETEKHLLGLTHCDIGHVLLQKWNFPAILSNSVLWHHQPSRSSELHRNLISIVHLADILVRSLRIGSGGDQKMPNLDQKTWQIFALSQDDLRQIMTDTQSEFSNSSAFIALTEET